VSTTRPAVIAAVDEVPRRASPAACGATDDVEPDRHGAGVSATSGCGRAAVLPPLP
jgi:hypothetical protein